MLRKTFLSFVPLVKSGWFWANFWWWKVSKEGEEVIGEKARARARGGVDDAPEIEQGDCGEDEE